MSKLARFMAFALCAIFTMAQTSPPTPGAVRRNNYPRLFAQSEASEWMVVKCAIDGAPDRGNLDSTIAHLFGIEGAGYGNISDYFYDVSYGKVQLRVQTTVGWVDAPLKSAGMRALQRYQRVEQCMDAVPEADRPDVSHLYGIIGMADTFLDDGACSSSGQRTLHFWDADHTLACVWFDPASMMTDFAAQEFLHGFGLGHSYDNSTDDCGANPGEYCDQWDIMSSMSVFHFDDTNWPAVPPPPGPFVRGTWGGPGLTAPALLSLNWVPPQNIRNYRRGDGRRTYRLSALSHPVAGQPLVIRVGGDFDALYTVEYRQADGWDAGFATNTSVPAQVRAAGGAVLVHQYQLENSPPDHPMSTLINNANEGAMLRWNTVRLPNATSGYYVRVLGIDTAHGFATVEIGEGEPPPLPFVQSPNGVQDRRTGTTPSPLERPNQIPTSPIGPH